MIYLVLVNKESNIFQPTTPEMEVAEDAVAEGSAAEAEDSK